MNIKVQANPCFKEVDRSKKTIHRHEGFCWIWKEYGYSTALYPKAYE
ncbi:MAG: hypothetical protein ACLUTF_04020 [Anaerostipes hadrus]